ncbi:MAG: extracellular solute-binding protein [Candidatus Izemoplasmataceae bacterium]
MKRIMCTILMFLMIFVLFGCQNQFDNDVITVWHDKEESVIQVLEDILAEELPDVKIDFIRKESLTDTLKLVGNDANSAPDMYIFAHDKIGLFAEIGILSPITEFIDVEQLEEYVDITIEGATYKDEIYQLPFYFETLLFMYNKDRMSEEEVPKTSEELYQYMVEHTDARRYGFVEQHSNAYYSAGWIHGFGGSLLSNDGVPLLDSAETKAALAYHLKFIEYMPKGQAEYATVNTLFYEKAANSIIAGPWIVAQARENGIDLGFARMPVIDETGLPIAPYAGIQGIHVLKIAAENDERKAVITDILNVFTNPQIGIDMALNSGVAPAHSLAYEDEMITSNELVMAMRDAALDAIPMPNIPEMDIMWTTASNMLVDINLKGEDIETVVALAQKESEDLIELMK